MWAIIGSSGFESFDEFTILETLPRETPFGLCSNGLYRIKIQNTEALFLCRTSQHENLLPNKINYRANIYALKKQGATAILALSSVRSLQTRLKPGEMVVPYQYIDQTKGVRTSTFCDNGLLAYISLTHPIAESAANKLKKNHKQFDFTMHFAENYVCIDGPQFPTMIDAHCYQSMGGGIIGMSAFPEFALAREAGLHYLPSHFIVDYVPWSEAIKNNDCILETRHDNYHKAKQVVYWVIENLAEFANQDCNEAGIAAGVISQSPELTPKQASWFAVLARSNSKSVQSRRHTPKLYHANKAMPEKLINLLSFVNKYRKEDTPNITAIRKRADSLVLYAGEKAKIASVRDLSVKLKHRDVKVRLYHPDPTKNLPIIIYTHGGGFVSGSIDAFDGPCRALANASQYLVVSIDYALAPEHPYPAGLNDVYEVANWVYHHASDIKAISDKFTMIGDSAGGNYTALSIDRANKSGDFKVAQQVLIYPTTDLSHQTESMQTFGQGYLLEASDVSWFKSQYKPKDMDSKDPCISPLYIKNLSDMPRTLVITAGYDPLRDEGLLFAEQLIEEGVDTHHYHFDNMIHGFIHFAKIVPDETAILYQRIHQFLHH